MTICRRLASSSSLLRALAGLLCLLPLDVAGQATGVVVGRIADAFSTPLMGIEVRVDGTSRRTITDRSGRFTLVGLDSGEYTIRASGLGYLERTANVRVVTAARLGPS